MTTWKKRRKLTKRRFQFLIIPGPIIPELRGIIPGEKVIILGGFNFDVDLFENYGQIVEIRIFVFQKLILNAESF